MRGDDNIQIFIAVWYVNMLLFWSLSFFVFSFDYDGQRHVISHPCTSHVAAKSYVK
jgi:hypothetical protein